MYIQPALVKAIIRDFTSETITSYQLAYRYHLYTTSVAGLLRAKLSEEQFTAREGKALESLLASLRDLSRKGVRATDIMQQLGLARRAYYALLPQVQQPQDSTPASGPDQMVEMISLSDDQPAARPARPVPAAVPGAAPAATAPAADPAPDTGVQPAIPAIAAPAPNEPPAVQVAASRPGSLPDLSYAPQVSDTCEYSPDGYPGYSRQPYWHRPYPRRHAYSNPFFVRMTVRGITVSFDSRLVPESHLRSILDCLNQL